MIFFKLELLSEKNGVFWFNAKDKYLVRFDSWTGAYSCTCMKGSFVNGKCKHVLAVEKKLKERLT